MNKQVLAALIVLGLALVWARKSFAATADVASAGISGVDRDSRAGVSPVTGAANEGQPQKTRPQIDRVIALDHVRTITTPVQFQSQRKLQPYGVPVSARAAFNAPIRVDYTPSSRATSY